jgi:hypothetical protein
VGDPTYLADHQGEFLARSWILLEADNWTDPLPALVTGRLRAVGDGGRVNSPVITGALHRFLETHATVRAMCILGPSVRSPRTNRAKRTLALWARRAVQQHNDRHESSEQSGKRKPIQPKAIGCKNCRQNAKDDARKHEQHRLISTSLQIIPYRHRPTSYRRHSRSVGS